MTGFKFFRKLYTSVGQLRHALAYWKNEYFHRASAAWSTQRGVTAVRRNPELIVSLTSIPERMDTLALCLDSLLRQSLKPDRLILWLSESNDSGRPVVNQTSLPANLLKLERRGLEIRWCKDIRSYRKIVPTFRAHPSAIIVTADDDIFYSRDWLKTLYEAYQVEPQYLHCHRAHQIRYDPAGMALPYNQWNMMANGERGPSFDLFPTGVGGVLYAPGQLHPDVLDEETFLTLCPKADDVWLKAMSLLVNIPCKKVALKSYSPMEIRIPNNRTLSSENVTLNGNDPQIRAVGDKYSIFRKDSAGAKKLGSNLNFTEI